LGQCVAGALAAEGWEVRSLDRRPASGFTQIPFVLGQPIQTDALVGLDALVHCAYDFSVRTPDAIRRVNVDGSRHLVAAAREANVRKRIWVSSISAFPGCRSLYGSAKLAIEEDALDGGATVIRPGLIWSESPGSTFGNLVTQLSSSKLIPLIGDGSQVQYLVHRDDLAGFIVGLCTGRLVGTDVPVTVAHPRGWAFADLLKVIARGLGQHPVLVPLPWRAIWLALRAAEAVGMNLRFRSDSVVSLVNQNRAPDFRAIQSFPVVCRPFPEDFTVTQRDRSIDRS
jgi:nucleoside-diphosphate-sugar epimerase